MASLMDTITAKSDQLNADDLMEPRTVTITGVTIRKGKDQPATIHFEGDNGKPYKPCLTCRRILGRAWGNIEDGSTKFNGRKIALYTDPAVIWGGKQVGGVRISAVSHIERSFAMPLTITRGRKEIFTVKKLQVQESQPETVDQQDDQTGPSDDEIEEAKDAARTAAKGGKDSFGVWWNSDDGKSRRAMVKDIMPELQETAAEADAMAEN